jgi:myo-inositol-1(or 4)-monophosphatase
MQRYEGPASGVERKSSRTDMVSDADKDAETLIRDLLASERPDDGLLAEEGAHRDDASGRRWVVDPLDGTTNYLYRFPAWNVSVALEDGDGSLVGVVHDPLRGETFTAIRGAGSWLDERPLEVRAPSGLDTALVATGFGYSPERRAAQADLLTRVLPQVRDIRRAGAAALDLCWVAAGRVDAYYERGLNHWDWAAASLVVSEAGGELRPLEGEPAGLMASAPEIADGLYELVG